MTKHSLIIVVLIFCSLCLSFKSANKQYQTFKVSSAYCDLKAQIKVSYKVGGNDIVDESYNTYVHFKEDSANFEYYSLFDSSLFIFFRDIPHSTVYDSLSAHLNYKTPVLVKYKSNKYRISTDIRDAIKSLPSKLHCFQIGSCEYLIVQEDIVTLQPPVGYNYLVLKFEHDKLLKHKFTFSKEEVPVKDLIDGLNKGR